MKNTTKFLLVISVITSVIANAQKISWVNGDKDVIAVHSILGYDDGGYYIYRYTNEREAREAYYDGDFIEKHSYDGKIIYTKSADYSEGKNTFLFRNIYMMKTGFILVNYDNKSENFCAVKINLDGTFSDKKDVLCHGKLMPGLGKILKYKFYGGVSNDKAYFLGYYHEDKNDITIKVLNDDLSEKWSKNVSFPVDGDFTITKALTDGNKAYFLVNVKDSKNRSRYSMITVDGGSNTVKSIRLNPEGDNSIYSVDFRIAKTGEILFTASYEKNMPSGFFSLDEGSTGYAVMRIDANSGKENISKSTDFDKDLILKFVTEKKWKRVKAYMS
ncbi:MAG TPA: hypothetical protein VK806_12975 [Bacteroidia bacterium]|nr:hypothetical protein [Bacteroidia bacterium]